MHTIDTKLLHPATDVAVCSQTENSNVCKACTDNITSATFFRKNIESIFHVLLLIGSQALVHPFDLHLL